MKYCEKCKNYFSGNACTACNLEVSEVKSQPFQNKILAENNSEISSETQGSTTQKIYRTLIISLFLCFTFFFIITYFIIHSDITKPKSLGNVQEKFILTELINRMDIKEDNSFEVRIFSTETAHFLSDKIDFTKLSFLGYQVSDFYYHEDLSQFALSLYSPWGKTTLLLDGVIFFEDEILNFQLKNPKIGKYKIPLPSFWVSDSHFTWKIDPKQFKFVHISSIISKNSSILVNGQFSSEYFNKKIQLLKQNINSDFTYFLQVRQKKTIPGYHELLYGESGTLIGAILKLIAADTENALNWHYIIPTQIMASEINRPLFDLLTTQEIQKYEILAQQLMTNLEELQAKYDIYVEKELKASLINTASIAFQSIETFHTNKGVPAYYFASHGKLYSQTLQIFITLGDLFPYTKEESQFELYAYGSSAIIGKKIKNEFWYVAENNPYEVETAEYTAFLNQIGYQKSEGNPPLLAPRGNTDRSSIAKVISNDLKCNDSIFINYLSIAGNDAFLIATPDYNTQSIFQYLLKKENGIWKIIDQISAFDPVHLMFADKIEKNLFDVRILPPFEVSDFQRTYLSENDLYTIASWLYFHEDFTQKFQEVAAQPINYCSAFGSNIFITYNADHKYLFNEIHKVRISKHESLMSYFLHLTPHSNYSSYYPTFIFYQD